MGSKGEEALKAFLKFSEDFPESFKKFTAFTADTYTFFDPKIRELIVTTILAVKGYEAPFKYHLNELMRNGFTIEELKNLLLLILTYLGAPKFLQVYTWCKEEKVL